MALFAIQLVRIVLSILTSRGGPVQSYDAIIRVYLVTGIGEMFCVIIRSVSASFVLLITFTWLGHHTNNNFVAGLNEIVLR